MSFRRGDVVVVLFPDSNLRTAKGRPALIVQADNLGTGIQQTIVATRSCLSRLRLARDTRRQQDRLEEGFDYHDGQSCHGLRE